MMAIATASREGNLDEIKRLVADGANPSCVIQQKMYPCVGYVMNETPIIIAIWGGDHVHVVKYFVEECEVGELEKTTAIMNAILARRVRCAAYLFCHGTMFLHGPFPKKILSTFMRNFTNQPLAMLCHICSDALDLTRILQENAWSRLQMSKAFHFTVRFGKWTLATCLFKAGAVPSTTLEEALGNAACPPDLRKMLWAHKISAELATTVRLACVFGKRFSKNLSEFDDKIALLHGPVTRHMRLQVAMAVTPDPFLQSFLVKDQLPVTAKSSIMSFVLHERADGLPQSLLRHIVGFVGDITWAHNSLTGKMLVRRGVLLPN